MKVNYQTHPILNLIKQKNINIQYFEFDREFYDIDSDKLLYNNYEFRESWKNKHSLFSTTINIVSDPFFMAVDKSVDKLSKILCEVLKNEGLKIHETFISRNITAVFSCNYEKESPSEKDDIFVCLFDNQFCVPLITLRKGYLEKDASFTVSNLFRQKYNSLDNESGFDMALIMVNSFLCVKMFKEYAEVETKTLFPNSKIHNIHCKYVNNSKEKLTFLDSKWFTNLVKSDAFKVSGHFRMQPHKNNAGVWTKKLIWINDFTKEGYTSKAKILTQ